MSTIFTPRTNTVANILNRRTETIFANTMTKLTDFDHLMRTRQEFGDTLEFIQNALAEKNTYNPKSNNTAKYVDTILNKYYKAINVSNVYYSSTPDEEYSKAVQSPKALAELSKKVVESMSNAWAVDLYNEFNTVFSDDWGLYKGNGTKTTLQLDLPFGVATNFDSMTEEQKATAVNVVINKIMDTIEDMRFYGQDYINVDSTLTAQQKAKILGNADYSDLTLYIHYKWNSLIQTELSKRFRNLADLDQKIKIVKIKTDSELNGIDEGNCIGFIFHNNFMNFYPKTLVARESQPLDSVRTDHALITEGTLSTCWLYPHTKINVSFVAE